MKPVKQEFLHDPMNGIIGDCFRACVASIFNLQLKEVPHFVKLYKNNWYKEFNKWLEQFDLIYVDFQYSDEFRDELIYRKIGFHLISGLSPRATYKNKTYHAVVGFNGEVFFDPHPDNTGLINDKKEITYGLFIKRMNE